MALTYFSLWMTRLMGLLPDIARCIVCGEPLRGTEVSYSSYADGLVCAVHRNGSANAAFRRLVATGATDVARTACGLCRGAVAAASRAGSATLYAADTGTASGKKAAQRGGIGAAGWMKEGGLLARSLKCSYTTCMEVQFPPDVEARLAERAARQCLSPDEAVRDVVTRYFQEEDRFVAAVQRGEAALDSRQSLTHEQVGDRLRRFLEP